MPGFLRWSGLPWFKKFPYAAQMVAENAAKAAMEHGLKTVEVYVKGPGQGRKRALSTGLEVNMIKDVDSHSPQWLPSSQTPPRGRKLR